MSPIISEFRLYLCNHWVNRVPAHAVRRVFYRRVMGFDIAPTATVFLDTRFDCARNFSLGEDSTVNGRCRLDNRGGLRLGRFVAVSEECIFLTADHDPHDAGYPTRLRETVVEDHVWIGTRATILPGVRLGEGCVVGAGSIVTKDVPPYVIVAGNPARKIGERPRGLTYRTEYARWFW
jgi:maltose O-acetyltransferase